VNRIIRSVLLPVIYLSFATQAFAEDSTPNCRRFAEDLRQEMVTIVHDKNSSFKQKHQALVRLFQEALDMEWIAQNVAGSYWRNAGEQERKAYFKAYVSYLPNFYIGNFDEDDLNGILDVTLTKFKEREPKQYFARTQITQKFDEPIDAEFELVEAQSGKCHIHDFMAEGVSMLDTQREEIRSLGEKGGLPYITERLNARPQAM